jgi:hypothetical protein
VPCRTPGTFSTQFQTAMVASFFTRSLDQWHGQAITIIRQAVRFADANPQAFGDAKARRRRKRRRSGDQTPPQNNLNVPYRSFLPGPGRDQLPISQVANAATRGVNRVSELGEPVNKDQEDPNGEMVEEQLVGTLPECPPGMTYQLEREPTGEINVVLVPDDSNGPTTHDRTFRTRIFREEKKTRC